MAFIDALRIILAVINIIANLIGFVFGGILLGTGIVGLVFFNFFSSSDTRNSIVYLNAGFGVFVAVGVIFCLFSIFAIVGSYLACCPGNKVVRHLAIFLLTLDLIALSILLVLEIVGIILAFVYRDRITGNFVSLLSDGFNTSYSSSPNATQELITSFQRVFDCCGINDAMDFAGYTGYPDGDILPPGCCNVTIPVNSCTLANQRDAMGCGVLIRDSLVYYSNVVGGVGIFNVIVILLLVVIELVLIIAIAKSGGEDGMKIV